MSMNLNEPEFCRNPYPYYARLREGAAPYWLAHDRDTSSDGVWLFSRYADAQALFRKVAGISKEIRRVRAPGRETIFDLHMLHRDSDDHLRLRRLVAGHFSNQHMRTLDGHVRAVAAELIQAMRGKDQVDLIAEFAEPMPLYVMAGFMGIPREDMAMVRRWSLDLGAGFDSVIRTQEILTRQREALAEFIDYARTLIAHPPGDSLLSELVHARRQESLSQDELVAMLVLLLFAGHETTINLIGNGLWLLMSHPEQRAVLSRDQRLLESAVEETLRMESPEQRTSFRMLLEPVEINGFAIDAGQQVGAIIGAANRDEREFPNADVFDVSRAPNRHLAFGIGKHNCLGKTLARLEGRIALGSILAAFPRMEPLSSNPDWRLNSFFRGLTGLPACPGHPV